MGSVMQLARTLHGASEAIRLVSNPLFSKDFDQNMLCSTPVAAMDRG
jgi:hypothetical protein